MEALCTFSTLPLPSPKIQFCKLSKQFSTRGKEGLLSIHHLLRYYATSSSSRPLLSRDSLKSAHSSASSGEKQVTFSKKKKPNHIEVLLRSQQKSTFHTREGGNREKEMHNFFFNLGAHKGMLLSRLALFIANNNVNSLLFLLLLLPALFLLLGKGERITMVR